MPWYPRHKLKAREAHVKLRTIDGQYGVAQLAADAPIPNWINGPGFSAIIRSDDELTLICDQDRIPATVTSERDWACFRSIGPFAFEETGIVAALVTPISAAGIGVFVVCTFDGEHILVPQKHLAEVEDLLTENGHHFIQTDPAPPR